MLALAGTAFVNDVGAHGCQHILAGIKGFPVTACHDGEGTGLSAAVSAGNRGIQGRNPAGSGFGIDALGELGAGGGHIDEHCTGLGIGNDTVFPEVDLFYVLGVAHDGDDDILVLCTALYIFAPDCTFLNHIQHLGFGAGVDGNGEALFHQVAYHGFSHHADTDKSDCFHRNRLFPELFRSCPVVS